MHVAVVYKQAKGVQQADALQVALAEHSQTVQLLGGLHPDVALTHKHIVDRPPADDGLCC